jgi:NADH:ubiquinone oxidoreductase subunit 3 (subunit A)
MGERLISDIPLLGVHIQTWMLVVLAIFLFGFAYVWRQQR